MRKLYPFLAWSEFLHPEIDFHFPLKMTKQITSQVLFFCCIFFFRGIFTWCFQADSQKYISGWGRFSHRLPTFPGQEKKKAEKKEPKEGKAVCWKQRCFVYLPGFPKWGPFKNASIWGIVLRGWAPSKIVVIWVPGLQDSMNLNRYFKDTPDIKTVQFPSPKSPKKTIQLLD